MEPEVRVQRAILRTIQKHQQENNEAAIERSLLGLHTRPYDQENWGVALDDLVNRGLVVEDSTIRAKQSQKRAVIIYRLAATETHPNFDNMTPEALQTYLTDKYPLPQIPTLTPSTT